MTPDATNDGQTPADSASGPEDATEWLSSQQAADRLGITQRTVYKLIDEGQLAAYKFGRVIRITAADVEAFVAASRIQPGDLTHLYPHSG